MPPRLLEESEAPELAVVEGPVGPLPEQLGGPEDPREGRPELVAHAREEGVLGARRPFQLRVHPLELDRALGDPLLEGRVQGGELGQGVLAGGDVGHSRRDRDHRAVRAANGRVDRLEVIPPRLRPVGVRLAGERPLEALPHPRVVVRRDEGVEVVSERHDLGRRRGVDDPSRGAVEREDAPLPVDEADRLGNRLEDRVGVEEGGRRGGLADLQLLPDAIHVSTHGAGV